MPSVSVRLFKGYDDFGNRLGSWGVPEVRRVRVHDGIGPTSDSVSANCAGVLPSGFVPTHIEVDFGGRRFVREVVDNGIEFEPSGFTVKGKGIAEASELLTRVRVDLSGGLNNVLRVPRFGSLNDLAVARGTSLGELVLYELKDVRVSVGAVMRVLAEWSLGLRLGRVSSAYATYRTTPVHSWVTGSVSFDVSGGVSPERAVNRLLRGIYIEGGDVYTLRRGVEEPGLDVSERSGSRFRCEVLLLLRQMSAFHGSAVLEFEPIESELFDFGLGDRLRVPARWGLPWNSWCVTGLTHEYRSGDGLRTSVSSSPTYTDS